MEWGEWIDRECCQGLLLDSVVISEKRRMKTKRKFTGVVLSGRTLNGEAHRGQDGKRRKKDHSEKKEKVSKGRQPSEASCLSNSQSHTHRYRHTMPLAESHSWFMVAGFDRSPGPGTSY